MRLIVNTKALLAASLFISNEETRYHLKGVFVTPCPAGGVLLVATDGRRLAVIHDDEGHTDRDVILSTNWSDKLLKQPAKEINERRLVIDTGADDERKCFGQVAAEVRSHCKGDDLGLLAGYLTAHEVDGSFPAFSYVMPWAAFGGGIKGRNAVNPDYLTDCQKAALILGGTKGIEIAQHEEGAPYLVRASGVEHAVFCIMPLRIQSEWPSFFFLDHVRPKTEGELA